MLDLLCSRSVIEFIEERLKLYGPGISGVLFGAGWWFWIDAVVMHSVPFPQYLPGFIATIAVIMINVVRRDELDDYDPYDQAGYCRSRLWLFICYVVSFGAVIGSVWNMTQNYALKENMGSEIWPGVAGIFQVVFLLASAMVMFISRSQSDEMGGYTGI
eukprot:TRINITY_DN22487_c0_g2_i6.p2 TRINITY_DN22487_c0_g2~~TRINITY_DN22487_c0_g2_i6.p2  ORF type:complete len:159 (-),score=19.46 TRINITY_DN22487_c0_g2_i6:313-789(-)